MDILRNLFGHLTSGIIRLAVTVGIIAAVGYFLVKPALETTKELSREANQSFQQSFGETGQANIATQIEDVNKRVQREVQRSFRAAKQGGNADAKKLLRCVERANGNVNRIERCAKRY